MKRRGACADFIGAAETLDLPRVVSIQNAYNLLNRIFEFGLQRDLPPRTGRPAGLQSAGLRRAHRQISRRRRGSRTHDPVPGFGQRYKQAQGARSRGRLRRTGQNSTSCTRRTWRWPSCAAAGSSPAPSSAPPAWRSCKQNLDSRALSEELMQAIEQIHLLHTNPAP